MPPKARLRFFSLLCAAAAGTDGPRVCHNLSVIGVMPTPTRRVAHVPSPPSCEPPTTVLLVPVAVADRGDCYFTWFAMSLRCVAFNIGDQPNITYACTSFFHLHTYQLCCILMLNPHCQRKPASELPHARDFAPSSPLPCSHTQYIHAR